MAPFKYSLPSLIALFVSSDSFTSLSESAVNIIAFVSWGKVNEICAVVVDSPACEKSWVEFSGT